MVRHIKLFAAALILAGCVENTTQPVSQKTVAQYSTEISSLANGVFAECIQFASSGVGPNTSTFLNAGFSEKKVLGLPVYVRSVSGGNSLFDNQWVSFSFQQRQQSCLFTATGLGGGLWVTASYVRSQLASAGWKEIQDASNKMSTFSRGGKLIEMSGVSSGAQSQITLKAGGS